MSGHLLRKTAEWVWYARGVVPATVRTILAPLAMVFRLAVAWRNTAFDRQRGTAALPALSVGNLTVGGTGKTPVASWFAARLHARGALPAIVLRGYGDDEWRVHEMLTPAVPVVVDADRVRAMSQAQAMGADCAVLDDAFQHRRAARVADVVLISADRFTPDLRVLPAGPYRETPAALTRATSVVITVKSATDETVAQVERTIRQQAPSLPVAVVRLLPGALVRVGSVSVNDASERLSLGDVGHRRVLLVSAIADPDAFEKQIVACGMQLVRHLRFPDHHAFTTADVQSITQAAGPEGMVVCTLKDAVKLAPLWPRAHAALWYVSQTLVVDRGAEVLERECDRVLAARTATVPTVG